MNNAYVQLKFSSKIGALGMFDSIFWCLELDDFDFIGSVFISATFEHRKMVKKKKLKMKKAAFYLRIKKI